jgi:Ca2+-binding EF-hand superfamily protein
MPQAQRISSTVLHTMGYGELDMISGIGGQNADVSAMWRELLSKADNNGDGRISKTELKEAMPQSDAGAGVDGLFGKIDTNGDGFIDKSEDAAVLGEILKSKRHSASDPLQVFRDADKDGDGRISKADFKSALPPGAKTSTANQVFDSMDTNRDGIVDASEYMAAMEKTGLMTQLFPEEGFSTLA